jgi:2-hydroxy-6-oxonona-2,4-dienedioate hydrolase
VGVVESGLHSDWTRVGALRLHARVSTWPTAPDSPTVVLVHGFVVSSSYMVPTARRLRPRWRVLAPDLPGFGASDHPGEPRTVSGLADALAGWMRARGLPSATLLGNSLGCEVVVDLAVRYPELAEQLVLVGPTVDPAARSIARQLGRLLLDAPRERTSLIGLHVRDWFRAGPRRRWWSSAAGTPSCRPPGRRASPRCCRAAACSSCPAGPTRSTTAPPSAWSRR